MRSLRPCSDSSATPSFPSQPEGKIGLPRANPRGFSGAILSLLCSKYSQHPTSPGLKPEPFQEPARPSQCTCCLSDHTSPAPPLSQPSLATPASLPFLEHTRPASTSGHLLLLFPLPGSLFPDILVVLPSPPSILPCNVTCSARPATPTLCYGFVCTCVL